MTKMAKNPHPLGSHMPAHTRPQGEGQVCMCEETKAARAHVIKSIEHYHNLGYGQEIIIITCYGVTVYCSVGTVEELFR